MNFYQIHPELTEFINSLPDRPKATSLKEALIKKIEDLDGTKVTKTQKDTVLRIIEGLEKTIMGLKAKSEDTRMLVEKEKLLAYCEIAYSFENNGNADEHADKLHRVFSKAETAFRALDDYAKQTRKGKGYNKDGQFVHESCLFTLPVYVAPSTVEGVSFSRDESEETLSFILEFFRSNFNDATIRAMLPQIFDMAIYYKKMVDSEEIKAKRIQITTSLDSKVSKSTEGSSDSRKIFKALRSAVAESSKTNLEEIKQKQRQIATKRKEGPTTHDAREAKKQNLERLNREMDGLLRSYVELYMIANASFTKLSIEALLGLRSCYLSSTSPSYRFFVEKGLSRESISRFKNLKRDVAGQNIPKISFITLEEFPLYYMRKLDVSGNELDAAKAACLGKLTHCCQSIGDAGESCALHGLTSPNGGFYVMFKKTSAEAEVDVEKDMVIAQSWAWRSTDGGLVFDSVEYVEIDKCIYEIIVAFWKALVERLSKEVNSIFVGSGGRTPRELLDIIDLGLTGKPVDHSGYRDSEEQVVLYHQLIPYLPLLNGKKDESIRRKTTQIITQKLDSLKLAELAEDSFMVMFVSVIFTITLNRHPSAKRDSFSVNEVLSTYCDIEGENLALLQRFIQINEDIWREVLSFDHSKIFNYKRFFVPGAILSLVTSKQPARLPVRLSPLKFGETLDQLKSFYEHIKLQFSPKQIYEFLNSGTVKCYMEYSRHDYDKHIKFPESHTPLARAKHAIQLFEFFSDIIDFEPLLLTEEYKRETAGNLFHQLIQHMVGSSLLSCTTTFQQWERLYKKIEENLLQHGKGLTLLIKARDRTRATSLHYAAGSPDVLKKVISFYTEGELLAAIKEEDSEGINVFGYARKNLGSLMTLVASFSMDRQVVEVITAKDSQGRSAIFSSSVNPSCLKYLISLLPVEKRLSALNEQDSEGCSILHGAIRGWEYHNPRIDDIQELLELYISPEQQLQALLCKDKRGESVLHRLLHLLLITPADEVCGKVFTYLRLLYSKFKKDAFLNLLLIEDKSGFTCLHLIIHNRNFEAFLKLFEARISRPVTEEPVAAAGDKIPEEMSFDILETIKQKGGDILVLFLNRASTSVLENFLAKLSGDELMGLLSVPNKKDYDFFSEIYQKMVLKAVLEKLSKEQVIQFCKKKYANGDIRLHRSQIAFAASMSRLKALGASSEEFEEILQTKSEKGTVLECAALADQEIDIVLGLDLDQDLLLKLFSTPDDKGVPLLHRIAGSSILRILQKIKRILSQEKFYQLVLEKTASGNTIFYHWDNMRDILDFLKGERGLLEQLYDSTNTFGNNILHELGIQRSYIDTAILESIPDNIYIKLIIASNCDGKTPLQMRDFRDTRFNSLYKKALKACVGLGCPQEEVLSVLSLLTRANPEFLDKCNVDLIITLLNKLSFDHRISFISQAEILSNKNSATLLLKLVETTTIEAEKEDLIRLLTMGLNGSMVLHHLVGARHDYFQSEEHGSNCLKLLQYLVKDKDFDLFDTKWQSGFSWLHIFFNTARAKGIVAELFRSFPAVSKSLHILDRNGNTVLHAFLASGSGLFDDDFQLVFENISKEHKLDTLLAKNSEGKSVLELLVNRFSKSYTLAIKYISSVSETNREKIVAAFKDLNARGRTITHYLIETKESGREWRRTHRIRESSSYECDLESSNLSLKDTLKCLPKEEVLNVILGGRETSLDIAVRLVSSECLYLKEILEILGEVECFSDDDLISRLKIFDILKAVLKSYNSELLKLIIKILTKNPNVLKELYNVKIDDFPLIHALVQQHYRKSDLEIILDPLTDDDRLAILEQVDDKGKKPYDYCIEEKYKEIVKNEGRTGYRTVCRM